MNIQNKIKLKLINISKKFDLVEVLKNTNLEVEEKEFIVILGPSGCGKTTLLRIIAGLEKQTSGEVFIENLNVSKTDPQDRDISMVFQNYGLYPHMKVKQNLEYPLKINKVKNREEIILKWASKVKISDYLDRLPKQLSGGQRQRVALARALVRSPKIYLMDEPLSNLDASLRLEMRSELKHLHEELNSTIIYVTHDQIEAMTLASRIVLMNNGIIEQIGTPQELYLSPNNIFVGSFIGSPPMNFIEGEIDNGIFNSRDIKNFKINNNTKEKVFLGIRPDDLKIGTNDNFDFNGKVFSSEYLGDGYLFTIQINDKKLLLKTQETHDYKTSDIIPVLIDKKKYHLFNFKSSSRLDK
ncbi:ABC transporter ATP-binding protein [Alphaproteobacteria bacterium]|nr:ABC transporter ATP-binding protein [Alphaproteobacteria bacterium]